MDSPQTVSDEQYKTLEEAGKLKRIEGPKKMDVKNNELIISTGMEGQAVSLFVVEW
jgi:hypothetical protein